MTMFATSVLLATTILNSSDTAVLKKEYGDFRATGSGITIAKLEGIDYSVKNISFQLDPKKEKPEAFLGPSGSGKSTTLRTLLRFHSPSRGMKMPILDVNLHGHVLNGSIPDDASEGDLAPLNTVFIGMGAPKDKHITIKRADGEEVTINIDKFIVTSFHTTKYGGVTASAPEVANAKVTMGNSWLFEGCYKYEVTNSSWAVMPRGIYNLFTEEERFAHVQQIVEAAKRNMGTVIGLQLSSEGLNWDKKWLYQRMALQGSLRIDDIE